MARESQEERILDLLKRRSPSWVGAPELARISLGYGARIHSLRRRGFRISNRVEHVDGVRHGWFALDPSTPLREREAG